MRRRSWMVALGCVVGACRGDARTPAVAVTSSDPPRVSSPPDAGVLVAAPKQWRRSSPSFAVLAPEPARERFAMNYYVCGASLDDGLQDAAQAFAHACERAEVVRDEPAAG